MASLKGLGSPPKNPGRLRIRKRRREPRRYATLVAAALVAKSQSALLTIVIPCYTKHHGAWKRLMGTILDGGHRHRDGAASATFYYPSCDFDAVSTRTIVSTMAEKALFSGSLIHFKNSTGPYDGEVSTLAETLRVAGAHGLSPAQTMDANMESMFNVIHREGTRGAHWPAYRNGNISTSMSMGTNKYWLQSMKKMYGCAAWGGNGTDDLCFMLDADSHVRRPLVGLCAVASHYQRHNRTVLVRPGATFERSADGQFGFGKYTRVVELSRDLLSTAHPETSKLRGAQFGEFYALELYHWMWTPSHVRLFLERAMDGSMAKLALSHPSKYTGWFFGGGPFIEETMYHFVYPRRHEMGYTFVSIVDFLRDQVSNTTFAQIMDRAGAYGSLGESLLTIFSEKVSDRKERARLAEAIPLTLGVRMARCAGAAGAFLKNVLVCTSA